MKTLEMEQRVIYRNIVRFRIEDYRLNFVFDTQPKDLTKDDIVSIITTEVGIIKKFKDTQKGTIVDFYGYEPRSDSYWLIGSLPSIDGIEEILQDEYQLERDTEENYVKVRKIVSLYYDFCEGGQGGQDEN